MGRFRAAPILLLALSAVGCGAAHQTNGLPRSTVTFVDQIAQKVARAYGDPHLREPAIAEAGDGTIDVVLHGKFTSHCSKLTPGPEEPARITTISFALYPHTLQILSPVFAGSAHGGSGGEAVATNAAQANAFLSFNVVLPSNATRMCLAIIGAPQEGVYGHVDSSTDGSYVLDEAQSSVTLADLQQQGQRRRNRVVVVNGILVLIQTWRDGSLQAAWLRGDGADQVLTSVEGPDTTQPQANHQTFSKQQALSIASDIISQGG